MLRAALNELYRIASEDDRVFLLSADNGSDYDFLFDRAFPGRYLNVGIAEGNMVGMASGLSIMGKRPFVMSAGPFLAYRAHEFIRNDMCLQCQPVVVLAHGSGISVGQLGPTHHATEDIAALRSIPGLLVLSPSCPSEAMGCVRYAYEQGVPAYIRLGMNGEKELYAEGAVPPDMRNPVFLRDGSDVSIVCTGSICSEALVAAEELADSGFDAAVVNVRCLSELPREEFAGLGERLFVVEEHQAVAGLFGLVSECAALYGTADVVGRIGLDGEFAESYGTEGEMRVLNGFDSGAIVRGVMSCLEEAS